MSAPNPATLELLGAGIQPTSLADDLNVTRQAVSYQLAGKSAQTSRELIEAIEARGGRDLAQRVAALIDRARLRRDTPE